MRGRKGEQRGQRLWGAQGGASSSAQKSGKASQRRELLGRISVVKQAFARARGVAVGHAGQKGQQVEGEVTAQEGAGEMAAGACCWCRCRWYFPLLKRTPNKGRAQSPFLSFPPVASLREFRQRSLPRASSALLAFLDSFFCSWSPCPHCPYG